MHDPAEPSRARSRKWLLLLLLPVALTPAIVVLLLYKPWQDTAPPPSRASTPSDSRAVFAVDYSTSNSVNIVLGENEVEQGLRHLDSQSDGLTQVETVNGVSARVLRRAENREMVYFYFQVHPSFK